jgi:glutathione S-transferase
MEKLFLLKPDFKDINRSAENKYFCPSCTLIEGLLSFYPRLRNELEVHYVDFVRPRPEIVKLIGEANQSCPVLVLDDGKFINEPDEIVFYLVKNHGIAQPH